MASLSAIRAHLLVNVGRLTDAASASGTVLAQLSELLTNRITTAKMAFIDAAISTVLSTLVNSTQEGTITTTSGQSAGDYTGSISSVNASKSSIELLGIFCTDGTTTALDNIIGRVALTNATTVTYSKGTASVQGQATSCKFRVVEYK